MLLSIGTLITTIVAVLGQNCNQVENCLTEYTTVLNGLQQRLQEPTVLKTFCSDKSDALDELKTCHTRVAGGDQCEAQVSLQNQMAEGMSAGFDQLLCDPEAKCGYFGVFRCYEDFFKGLGIDSVDTVEDLAKVLELQNFNPKNIDHEKFCKHSAKADIEEMHRCAQEKCKDHFGGEEDNGAEEEAEGGRPPMEEEETGGIEDNLDINILANFSILCQPGCEKFFETDDEVKGFEIDEDLIGTVSETEEGTDDFDEACGDLQEELNKAADLVQGCELQQKTILQHIESDHYLVGAMQKCDSAIEFHTSDSGASTLVISVSFHLAILTGLAAIM